MSFPQQAAVIDRVWVLLWFTWQAPHCMDTHLCILFTHTQTISNDWLLLLNVGIFGCYSFSRRLCMCFVCVCLIHTFNMTWQLTIKYCLWFTHDLPYTSTPEHWQAVIRILVWCQTGTLHPDSMWVSVCLHVCLLSWYQTGRHSRWASSISGRHEHC